MYKDTREVSNKLIYVTYSSDRTINFTIRNIASKFITPCAKKGFLILTISLQMQLKRWYIGVVFNLDTVID